MDACVMHYMAEFTYLGIFAFLILSVFGFPFPEDAVLLVSGVLVSRGLIDMTAALVAAYAGAIAGDFILYYAGLKYGGRILAHRRFGKILTRKRLDRIGSWLDRWGGLAVFIGRYLVGVRAQVLLCSGVFRVSAARVIIFDGLSALIGVPLVLMLGYLFGNNLPYIREQLASIQTYLTLGALFLALTYCVYYIYNKRHSDKHL